MKIHNSGQIVNFFKILSDPAEGYGHLVNKIMAKEGEKTWRLDFLQEEEEDLWSLWCSMQAHANLQQL